MTAERLLLRFLFLHGTLALSGNFWHITDLHWDPSYEVTNGNKLMCESNNSKPVSQVGLFGSYACDSPWKLINSSIVAMSEILPNPDFIVWTGDDTPHVRDEKLSEEKVLRIIGNLTQLIQSVFPNTKVYSALGNHDYHPKSQLPGHSSDMYNKTAKLWQRWLKQKSMETFQKGGYYTEKLLDRPGFRMLVLNTNLYYNRNNATENDKDPAGQFKWAEEILTKAAEDKEKVYIIGHVPPGMFEKKRGHFWYRPQFNERYLALIQNHHAVIKGQFFGHHHTDTFRMFYDSKGVPISTMFISPGVTPWETTLPGVKNGANNPGIRIFEYDTDTLLVQDVVAYYLNLTRANTKQDNWEKEYRLTESFQVMNASPTSMHQVLEGISKDNCRLQQYYRFNSVNFDLSECDRKCRASHVCAAREVDFQRYENCVAREVAPASFGGWLLSILSVAVSFLFVFA
ncbi:acid sphingomyelinase-like phosphodiesterase 3b [Corythoichthys intestinalis]|uniref:acid sphingomyelinase-like phosphodiesterase 3b n=1 Tax=Corythoichthys intestinalis TaxID=161448 RepID=UPI0025A5A9A4|nr:acid sphingomyelinase-like phosphodiesterase 3b [Corythoichthys intestinalis]XP_057689461.1 acid sphingomyelinase-like phosphodiesterase 3b [Corythoichthys intestinalis]XP_057689462.1 acid sphingomyelinase-like phosphodiesterase 3b [Corythoichthys intestinalis]XP_057689463.1 acid sphingomyelinase-like phosphodiesterase 3b [Corythoichthys intestinalis]XP_057689464.1 acid sphingomyelinase-like phosphodiesterase 3b [Corythoichthys intestinalis]XP_061789154.1 acid sphingomyelinase-like phosphod